MSSANSPETSKANVVGQSGGAVLLKDGRQRDSRGGSDTGEDPEKVGHPGGVCHPPRLGCIPGEAKSKQPGPHGAGRPLERTEPGCRARCRRGVRTPQPSTAFPSPDPGAPSNFTPLCTGHSAVYMHPRRPPWRESLPCQHACVCRGDTRAFWRQGSLQGDAGLRVPAELRPWGRGGPVCEHRPRQLPGNRACLLQEWRLQPGAGLAKPPSGSASQAGTAAGTQHRSTPPREAASFAPWMSAFLCPGCPSFYWLRQFCKYKQHSYKFEKNQYVFPLGCLKNIHSTVCTF